MPKQNRPLVRDGRIQARKKRTDRSYLGAAPAPARPPAGDDATDATEAMRPAEAAESAATATAAAPGKLPTTVRALQQQGVRKRRDVNILELARRDSAYALHELRRIFILTLLVVGTLLVLTYVLR